MRSLNEILEGCVASGRSFAAQALAAESAETGNSPDSIRAGLAGRLKDMEFSVREAAAGSWRGLLVPEEAFLLEEYGKKGTGFSSPFVLTAARISISVATYNSAMGRECSSPAGNTWRQMMNR